MSFLAIIWLITMVVLVLLIRSKIRADQLQSKHAHRQGHSQINANTSESGHSHTYYVTKDPDAYAKIFVPAKHTK